MTNTPFTVGVEEEFFLVDADTRALRPRAERVLSIARERLGDQISFELNLAQVETATAVCDTLSEVRDDVRRLRADLMAAAAEENSRILPAGTHPFSDWIGQQITPRARYAELDESYKLLAWEQLVCGCHVHVCVPDPDVAVLVIDHVRPWLPTLRALATNSPFWNGIDTGYASYRTILFDRWPTAGPPPRLGGRDAYDALVDVLIATGTAADASKIYWDVRPSTQYATVEYRVADVLPSVEDVVLLAALCRSLTRVAVAAVIAAERAPDPQAEVLRAARWRAARYGVSERLVDLARGAAVPAAQAVDGLLAHLRDDLEQSGEWQEVDELTRRMMRSGNGSARQRQAFGARGDHRDVVDVLVAATVDSHA